MYALQKPMISSLLKEFLNFSFCICKMAINFYMMIYEITEKKI